jgi:hypothetical protein
MTTELFSSKSCSFFLFLYFCLAPYLVMGGYYYMFHLVKSDLVFRLIHRSSILIGFRTFIFVVHSNLKSAVIASDNYFIQFCLTQAPHLFKLQDKKNRTLLHTATKHGQLAMIINLLALHDVPESSTNSGGTRSTSTGAPHDPDRKPPTATGPSWLLDPNVQDWRGYTALHLAHRLGFADMVAVLAPVTDARLLSKRNEGAAECKPSCSARYGYVFYF